MAQIGLRLDPLLFAVWAFPLEWLTVQTVASVGLCELARSVTAGPLSVWLTALETKSKIKVLAELVPVAALPYCAPPPVVVVGGG